MTPIRVLVADDSPTARALVVSILASDPELKETAEASNGLQALELCKTLRPDVATMDIHMPILDGLEATRRIMTEAPTPIVIVSGTVNVDEVEVSLNAIRAGALTILGRPPGPAAPDFEDRARSLVKTVKLMSQVKVVRRWRERGRPAPAAATTAVGATTIAAGEIRAVAIATSTGGPAALNRILADLPASFPAPILIVRRIAPGFVEGLAHWLGGSTHLKVRMAELGRTLEPGTAYIAPDDRHLGVRDGSRIELSGAPPIDGFRPSGTWLFRSVAEAFGPSMAAVILTGMGRDGVEGLEAVRRAGGTVLAQDERTSVVFGMPGAAIEAGVVHETLGLSAIGARLRELVQP